MTERHEVATLVQKALTEHAEVFGRFRTGGDEPAIAMKSVHHLYKIVNQKPLVRPAWYLRHRARKAKVSPTSPTHLVDLAQWMTGAGQPFDYERDVELLSARQWPTEVPRDLFARITGLCRTSRRRCAITSATDALHYFAMPSLSIACAAFRCTSNRCGIWRSPKAAATRTTRSSAAPRPTSSSSKDRRPASSPS